MTCDGRVMLTRNAVPAHMIPNPILGYLVMILMELVDIGSRVHTKLNIVSSRKSLGQKEKLRASQPLRRSILRQLLIMGSLCLVMLKVPSSYSSQWAPRYPASFNERRFWRRDVRHPLIQQAN